MAILKGTKRNDTLKDSSTDRNSDIYGYAGNDSLYGQNGIDRLFGGAGNDKLYGGNSDDWLFGDAGADRLDGGAGLDGASYYLSSRVIVSLDGSLTATGDAKGDTFFSVEYLGGSNIGNDGLAGNSKSNRIFGQGGDDRIWGRGGSDVLFGGKGEDKLFGENGNDWLVGESGADRLDGGAGRDGVSYINNKSDIRASLDKSIGGTGEARGDIFISIENLEGSNFNDMIAGNAGRNDIWGLAGDDTIYGRDGNDNLYGGDGTDSLFGEGGDDWLLPGTGNDILDGGDGVDGVSYYLSSAGVTVALDGAFVATGQAIGHTYISIENLEGSGIGADKLGGNESDNNIYGNGGNDALYGFYGNDSLEGGAGKDKLFGGEGEDYATYYKAGAITVSLDGSLKATGEAIGDVFDSIENLAGSETGNDRLAGDASNNELWGDGGNDILFGRAGDDKLFGNAGNDRLSGEAGVDTFAFKFKTDGVDVITDFEAGEKIEIRTEDFGVAPVGPIAETLFQSAANHVATTAEIRFLFDTTNNSLWFDSDGSGATKAVQLATFANAYQLLYTDIVISQFP